MRIGSCAITSALRCRASGNRPAESRGRCVDSEDTCTNEARTPDERRCPTPPPPLSPPPQDAPQPGFRGRLAAAYFRSPPFVRHCLTSAFIYDAKFRLGKIELQVSPVGLCRSEERRVGKECR